MANKEKNVEAHVDLDQPVSLDKETYKYIRRLKETDGGYVYTADLKVGVKTSTDGGEHYATFTVPVPAEIVDDLDDKPGALEVFLNAYDLKARELVRGELEFHKGSASQTLTPEEREKRRQEQSERMSNRQQVGKIAEDLDLTPEEVRERLMGS